MISTLAMRAGRGLSLGAALFGGTVLLLGGATPGLVATYGGLGALLAWLIETRRPVAAGCLTAATLLAGAGGATFLAMLLGVCVLLAVVGEWVRGRR